MTDDRETQVREKAYQLWQDEGEPDGRDQEHWAAAEQQLGGGGGADPTMFAGTVTPDPVAADLAALGSDDIEATGPEGRSPAAKAGKRGR